MYLHWSPQNVIRDWLFGLFYGDGCFHFLNIGLTFGSWVSETYTRLHCGTFCFMLKKFFIFNPKYAYQCNYWTTCTRNVGPVVLEITWGLFSPISLRRFDTFEAKLIFFRITTCVHRSLHPEEKSIIFRGGHQPN